MPSSYQVVLWKQESFVVLRPLQIEFFRNLLGRDVWHIRSHRTVTESEKYRCKVPPVVLIQSPAKGELHGKSVRSSPAVEEGTCRSTRRSKTFGCGIGRSWKPDGWECNPEAAYPIGCCSKEDQPRAESSLGEKGCE